MVIDVSVVEIELSKNGRSVVGLDETGKVVVRRQMMRRETVITYTATLPPAS